MKARRLIESASYPPDVLGVVFRAFDEAWAEIEQGFEGAGPRENGAADAGEHHPDARP